MGVNQHQREAQTIIKSLQSQSNSRRCTTCLSSLLVYTFSIESSQYRVQYTETKLLIFSRIQFFTTHWWEDARDNQTIVLQFCQDQPKLYPALLLPTPPPIWGTWDSILFLSVITAHKYVVRSAAMTHSYFIEQDIKILDTAPSITTAHKHASRRAAMTQNFSRPWY